MASDEKFLAFIRDQLRHSRDVSYRKMFGEMAKWVAQFALAHLVFVVNYGRYYFGTGCYSVVKYRVHVVCIQANGYCINVSF